jgi:hypothetical protein
MDPLLLRCCLPLRYSGVWKLLYIQYDIYGLHAKRQKLIWMDYPRQPPFHMIVHRNVRNFFSGAAVVESPMARQVHCPKSDGCFPC